MSKKATYYQKILSSCQALEFLSPSLYINKQKNILDDNKVVNDTTSFVTAPVLMSFVLWVLNDAKDKGIKRLFFLARDGLIMYRMAEIISHEWNLNIECKYLYCSRHTLYLPLYTIDKEDALERICITSSKVDLETVLFRAGIPQQKQQSIINEIGYSKNHLLSSAELHDLKIKLGNSDKFHLTIQSVSKKSLKNIWEYFKQEEILEKPFAVVDSGWTGSMQANIKKILEYCTNQKVPMAGYYFGMVAKSNANNGSYNCYYFSPQNKFYRYIFFNNNLFECLCSADHGMTIGYQLDEKSIWNPILKKQNNQLWFITSQLKICEEYAKAFAKFNSISQTKVDFDKQAFLLLKSFMNSPSKEEAKTYGSIPFSDDSIEGELIPLAEKLSKQHLNEYSFFSKVWRKLSKDKKCEKYRTPFWLQGSLALSLERVSLAKKIDLFLLNISKFIMVYFRKST